jgi:DNA polymerase I-like protein with 3'-5' exonuclease and polymerase domains
MTFLILDVETTTSNKGNPFDTTNKLCYVGLHDGRLFDIEYSADPYKELLDEIQSAVDQAELLVGFNIKFDLHWLARYGIKFNDKRIWDCQLVHFILTGQQDPYPSLNDVAAYYKLESKLDKVSEYWKSGIDTPDIPEDILKEYLIQDINLTGQIMAEQIKDLNKNPHLKRLVSLHNQDLLVLQEMEFNGLMFNYNQSIKLGEELEHEIKNLDIQLKAYHLYDDFNANSVDHLSAFLYGGNIKERYQRAIGHFKSGNRAGEIKYKWEERLREFPRRINPLPGTELAKEGLFSTDERTLRSLKGNKEAKTILDLLLTRATLEKRKSTYYQGLTKLIDEHNWSKGVIHGQLNQCVARTGRLSSSKPNLQNFDGEIKELFTSRYN